MLLESEHQGSLRLGKLYGEDRNAETAPRPNRCALAGAAGLGVIRLSGPLLLRSDLPDPGFPRCFVRSSTPKKSSNGTELTIRIDDHSERVRNQTVTCGATSCRHCGLDSVSAQQPFAFHGTRTRRFLVLVDSFVCQVGARLARWRCPRCRRTFTDYPPFARAHKAYTLLQMAERAAEYVSDPSTSYRKGVCSGNLPIFYEEPPSVGAASLGCVDGGSGVPAMAHTSLFRWVSTLADDAQRRSDDIPADFAPAPHKFTSEQRRSTLVACRAACLILLSDQALAR